MDRATLTVKRIQDFSCPESKGQSFLWDDDVKRLAVRCTPTGRKTFIVSGELHGKTVRLTIGDTQTWRIPEARTEARRLLLLLDAGTDPRELEKQAKEVAKAQRAETLRKQLTLGDIWPLYIEDASKHGRRKSAKAWGAHHLAAHARAVKRSDSGTQGALAPLLDIPISELTETRIRHWLEAETATRATVAALSYRMLRTCINWLAEHPTYSGMVSPQVMSSKAVTHVLPKAKTKDDLLRQQQIKPWFDAVRTLSNPVISVYLQVVLLTGRRREEILSLTWEEVDFRWNTILINDKVQGRVTLPLPPYCAQLLAGLPRRNIWVFSSPTAKDGRLQDPRIAHNKIIAAAGLPHVTIHGLRRTYATLTEEECPAGVAAQLQGHTAKDVRGKHYVHRSLDVLTRWSTAMESLILGFADLSPPEPMTGVPELRIVGK